MRRGLYLLVIVILFAVCTVFLSIRSPSGGLYQELGWQLSLPGGWVEEQGMLREVSGERTVQFFSRETTKEDLQRWLLVESNKRPLVKPVTAKQQNGLELYSFSSIETLGKQFSGPRYTGLGCVESGFKTVYVEDKVVESKTAVFYDGIKQYVFSSHGPVTSAEFKTIVDSFRVIPVRETLVIGRVKEISIFVPGAGTNVLTPKEDRQFIEQFIAAYNDAEIYWSDRGKAYPVVVTLTLQDDSQIEISGGSFDFQTVRIKDREFNIRGGQLQKFFTPVTN